MPVANPASPARLHDTAFEVFVKRAMRTIMDNSSGRSQEARKLREACQLFLGDPRHPSPPPTIRCSGIPAGLDPLPLPAPDSVNKGEARFVPPLSGTAREQVMAPLRMACSGDNPKVTEPALGCLHKLVGHAYLQGESTAPGKLDDPNLVSRVTAIVSKCGETPDSKVQLAVLRALLTITTAEHFVLHGDCLLQVPLLAHLLPPFPCKFSRSLTTGLLISGSLLPLFNSVPMGPLILPFQESCPLPRCPSSPTSFRVPNASRVPFLRGSLRSSSGSPSPSPAYSHGAFPAAITRPLPLRPSASLR